MDTSLLESFVSISKTQSFSQTAEQLHLTQSAVSKRIALLEQQLNCRLFDRVGRSIVMTEAGNTFLPQAQAMLQLLADSKRSIENLKGTVAGKLKLAFSHHIGLRRLPPVLKKYTQTYPDVELEVEFLESETAYQQVNQGKYELAVITLSDSTREAQFPNIESKVVWDDPMAFVASVDHEISQLKYISLEQLSTYPTVLPELSTRTGSIIKNLFDSHGLPLKAALTTNYLETICSMTTAGLGWSLLPYTMIGENLKILPVKAPNTGRKLGYIHHQKKTLSNAARAMLQTLDEYRT